MLATITICPGVLVLTGIVISQVNV